MKIILLILLFTCSSFQLLIGQETITGIVIDASTGDPLPGATIELKGYNIKTSSNPEGTFSIFSDYSANNVLLVSYVGYQSSQIKLDPQIRVYEIQLAPDIRLLNTVVVTATRGQREIHELPMRVDVIKREQIASVPAMSADTYLSLIPGVSVSRAASFLGSAHVSLRGMGHEAGRTLILLDGVPMNKSDGGSVNWNAINPGDIGQIEVAKGTGSSLYGGNAMGGIINFISPTPSKPFEAYVIQGVGSFSTYNTMAGVSGNNDTFFWSLNGRYRQSDGYITTPADETDEFSIASFLDEYQFGGRAGFHIGTNQMIELSGSYYLGQRGTGSKFTGFGFQNEELAAPEGAYNQYGGVYGRATYRGTFNLNSRLNITLFGQRENYQNIRENVRNNLISRYDVESIRQDLGILSSFSKDIHPNHKLTVGIDIRQGSVDGADVYITSTDLVKNLGTLNQTGLFIQNEIKLANSPWSILAGIRFDHARFYDGKFEVENPTNETSFLTNYSGSLQESSFNALSPRLSIQYYKENIYRIYAGYSQGFRAPVLDDMCRTGRISGGMKLANPDLKPEYLHNMEVGGDYFVSRILSISPSVFYSKGRDYHAYISTGDSLILTNRLRPIRMKDNIERVIVTGAEIAARLHISERMNLDVSYSHINTTISEFEVFDFQLDESLTGRSLVYQPKDLFNTSISWRNDILNVFVGFNYKGSQWINEVNTESIEAYNYTDMHVWKDIFRGFQVSLKAHNVFNQTYVDSRNIIGPGRILMMEAKYTF